MMNMQNKPYTTQCAHHSMTYSQSVPEQQSQNLEITHFTKFQKKVQTHGQERIQTHGKEN